MTWHHQIVWERPPRRDAAAFSRWRPTELASVDAEIGRGGGCISLNLIHPRREVVGVSACKEWERPPRRDAAALQYRGMEAPPTLLYYLTMQTSA